LSYGRSRYFTILFFILKISRNRTCENNKSCSIYHRESYKIGFVFSEFYTIFYTFYKNQQNCNTIEDVVLRLGPCNFSESHTSALRSHKTPRKDLGVCNGVPGRGRRRARRNSGSSGGSPGRGTTVGCVHAHLGPVCSWSWGGKLASVGNRRRSPRRRELRRDYGSGWTTNEPGASSAT
jgi:hypothetical protein